MNPFLLLEDPEAQIDFYSVEQLRVFKRLCLSYSTNWV